MKKINVKARFHLGAACILIVFCASATILAYFYLKKNVTENIYKETEIFIATADATRTYVKDMLRPTIVGLLPPEAFIPQAMSTSFVGREVMSRLHDRFPDFKYKRAAINPMNPINQADAFELEMLDWFNANKSKDEWHGLIQKGARSYFTRLRPIFAEAECLYCHGEPKDAPEEMKKIYGTQGGYHYTLGSAVAADTIYIPVDVSLNRIKEISWVVFLLVVTSMFSLFILFYLLFNRTIVLELQGILTKFQRIPSNDGDPEPKVFEAAGDETEQLKLAFEAVASDLKLAHDHLKSSEIKYRLLFETSQDVILIISREERLADINQAGINLFGFMDLEEARAIEWVYQLFWDPQDAHPFIQAVKNEGFVRNLEIPMVDRHGRKIMVTISATARYDKADQYDGLNAVVHDITERRQLEKAMAQTEKLASIGQLASGVAHEINNPLEVIRLYANLINKDTSISEQAKQDIAIIQKHTQNCRQIVESLLNFARVSKPEKVEIDIHDCIDDVLAVLEIQLKENDVNIIRQYGKNIPGVTVDAQQVRQVFMNILMNAKQAIKEEGDITIRTRVDATEQDLWIEISDTGSGISEESLARIFDPFYTTKSEKGGTGLGLSVSYGIIKQHGGDIDAKSEKGRGSQFRIRLPLNPEISNS
jgi:two-component system NtrC family sensor kinase